jgi:hypothetical protein
MEQVLDTNTLPLVNSNIVFTSQTLSPNIITVAGEGGSPLFSIKPNGEFVPGPGLDEGAIGEFARTFYKKMTIFGKSFSDTLKEKETRIKELENELEQLKKENGTSN